MADPSFGEIACWAFILGVITFAVARRLGAGPALVAATLVALSTKAALINLS